MAWVAARPDRPGDSRQRLVHRLVTIGAAVVLLLVAAPTASASRPLSPRTFGSHTTVRKTAPARRHVASMAAAAAAAAHEPRPALIQRPTLHADFGRSPAEVQ